MKGYITKKRMFYTLAVTLIVVFTTTYAVLMTLERIDYRNYLQAEYSKSMYELINALESIDDNLAKSEVVGTREQCMLVLHEIVRHSARANDKLHSLPIPTGTLAETSRFLAQVGDYCFTLVRATSGGTELSDEDYGKIEMLRDESFNLKEQLNMVLTDINEGRVEWGEIRQKATGVLSKANENLASEKFKLVEKQVTQYPELVYNGPFSDSVLQIEPKVNQQEEVTVEEAKEIVKNVLGKDRVENIEVRQNNGETRIESYDFIVSMKGRDEEEGIVCEVSKHGGRIVYMLDNRALGQPTMEPDKAMELGARHLEENGYKNMIPTHTLRYEDNIVVNYIHNINEVMVYPDQIKLKIAMDDGSIIGVEAERYLISHVENRQIPEVKVTEEEARKRINKRMQINTVRLAVIPTELNGEVLCYEYSGRCRDDDFLFYINAETGEPERLLKMINTPNGPLAM